MIAQGPSIALFSLIIVLGPAAGYRTCQAQSRGPMQHARVRIIAVDSFGVPATSVRIVQFSDKNGHDFAQLFHDQSAENIPLGTYRVRLATANLGPMFQEVSVRYSNCFFVFARSSMHFGHVANLPVLSGLVKLGGGGKAPSWVKLCGVFLDGCLTSKVEPDGTFFFTN